MEFSIDLITNTNGQITILDLAKDRNQYLDNSLSEEDKYTKYKYAESITINVLTKVTTESISLLEVLSCNHSNDTDACTFKVSDDGYYVIDHIVLPTRAWYDSFGDRDYFSDIYITDGKEVYKLNGDTFEECTIKEIMERNPEGTTIKRCKVDIIYTGNLQQCYYQFCSNIFENVLDKCAPKIDTFDRDFIWMTLNIIDYLACSKQYLEAQRIIEMFTKCNGFYNITNVKRPSCGCVERKSY